MPVILDIATAVPEYGVSKEQLVKFYCNAFGPDNNISNEKKIRIISEKTGIDNRYSCIPDFHGSEQELFTGGDYKQSLEKRTMLYKKKIMPLASAAVDKLFIQTGVTAPDITHLITVSCTGIFAPGLEFRVAEHYG